MDIKQINEELRNIVEANLEDRNAINFENVGCGFELATGTSGNGLFTLYLQGFSANITKNIEFESQFKTGYGTNMGQEERKQLKDEFEAKKAEVRDALLKAANEFDAKVAEIMESFGFRK